MRKALLACTPVVGVLVAVSLPILSGERDVYTAHVERSTDGTVVQTARVTSLANLRRQQAAGGPRAQVDNPVHNFGRQDALTVHDHVFVIRNVGDAPLDLTEGPTSCKCTLARLQQHTVPPGGKTQAVVRWNTGRDETYAHSATVYTNDPRNPALRLSIKGEVRTLLRCVPDRLVFARVEPGETPSAAALVYSQIWPQLDLESVVPTMPGIEYTIEECDPAEQESLHATSARRITITLPPDLPEGYFSSGLVLHCKPPGGAEEPIEYELPVEGKVIRRLCVYGPEIDVQGTINLGRIRQGTAAHVRLLLKLRDPVSELPVKRIHTTPSFLQVRIEPHGTAESTGLGLYYLHIGVPKDAPTFRLPPARRGTIHIEFDHPRCTNLDLPVDLIVIAADGV